MTDILEWSDDDDIPLSELSAIGLESSVTMADSSFHSNTSEAGPSRMTVTSTPRKKKLKPDRRGNASSIFRVPAQLHRCPRCKKSFKTVRGLKDHTDMHLYTDAAAKRPDARDIETKFLTESRNIVDKIGRSSSAGPDAEVFLQFVNAIKDRRNSDQWVSFVKTVAEHLKSMLDIQIVLPSQLREHFLVSTNKLLNDTTIVEDLMEKLQFEPCSSKVKNMFLFQFVMDGAEAVLVLIFQRIRETISHTPSTDERSTDNFESVKTQEVVHYIAGSCVRGFLKRALKLSKNQKWCRIKEVLCGNFLKASVPIACANEIEAWTAALNRRNLLFVKDNVFVFFLELAKLLSTLELPRGSLGHKDVQFQVFQSPHLLFLWSDIVKNSLKHEESINLLRNMVKSFTNTFGNGVQMRRRNEVLTPKPASVGLRATLASSKQ